MSRAFTKESDGALDPLPDLPISPHPNHVTPQGLAELRGRLLARQADLAALRARAERLDKLPEAAAERDIRYLESRLRSAILIDPAQHPLTEVAFGLIVTAELPDGSQTRLQIVGEDEADPARGRITAQSPLARALMGAMSGDRVDWQKPGGTVSLTILSLAHPDT
jgi:transcription elongation GreA/GreB family factor